MAVREASLSGASTKPVTETVRGGNSVGPLVDLSARTKTLHNQLDELSTAREGAAEWDRPAELRGTKPQHSEKAKQAEGAHDGSAGGAHDSGPTKDRVVEVELHCWIVTLPNLSL